MLLDAYMVFDNKMWTIIYFFDKKSISRILFIYLFILLFK